jgi:TonB family protein
MRSKSSSRGKEGSSLKALARSLPHLAVAAALLPGAGPARPMQVAAESAAPRAASLIVCDPPAFQDCHRVEGVTPPRVIHSETPVYPLAARRLKLEGVSVVSLVIDTHGVPRNVATAQSIADEMFTPHRDVAAEMDKNAVDCVRKFRFAPATLHGKPVATQVTLRMNFHHTAGS